MKINKNSGFTLSEVMITVAMIGVIATMTTVTMGSSLHHKSRVSEFKTAYALITKALNDTIVENGHAYRCYSCPSDEYIDKYGLNIKKIPRDTNGDPIVDTEIRLCSTDSQSGSSECNEFEEKFIRNLNATYTCAGKPIDNGCIPETYAARSDRSEAGEGSCFKTGFNSVNDRAYILENSMIIFPDPSVGNISRFAIDVNGKKGPNIWGQDIFTFAIVPSEESVFGTEAVPAYLRALPPQNCLLGKRSGGTIQSKGTVSTDQMLDEIWGVH